ncbi:hypothetical protein MSAN_02123200 [Mycena sanguinolenta]|uniref:Transmembrane protein n=1 Tax=Mycena sanguinolenta TaxID=230812 RepID=A0A8H6XGA6_9AGAR|nr:hypothetical protein MSAN_02123200 [Mycena sanguinolenta]
MNQIFSEFKSFRFGYTEAHPYPWRWTTPIVLGAFLLITPFLAVVNVPLSAYNREFALQPLEPSDGCFALRKLMADGSNGCDTCLIFFGGWVLWESFRASPRKGFPLSPNRSYGRFKIPELIHFDSVVRLQSTLGGPSAISHQFAQRQTAIRWLQWLQRKLANVIQEATYRPNDTLPTPLSKLIPSVLQSPADSFTSQLLSVGDTLVLDDCIFNYTITQAFNDANQSKPVSAFSYYNNPLSQGCDSTNITVHLQLNKMPELGFEFWSLQLVQFSGTVTCQIPTLFYLTWSGRGYLPDEVFFEAQEQCIRKKHVHNVVNLVPSRSTSFQCFLTNIPSGADQKQVYNQILPRLISVSLCILAVIAMPFWRAAPLKFLVVDVPSIALGLQNPIFTAAGTFGPLPIQITDVLSKGGLGDIPVSSLASVYGNLVQTLHHLVRVDLGVIVENQIYNSPKMYNRTILKVVAPPDADFTDEFANTSKDSTSNVTLMAQWQQNVEFFQTNVRVPPLEYLRPVPRLKLMGSAVTSVFVSTFAMLSVMWTVFSLVAGALARSSDRDRTTKKQITLTQRLKGDKWLESGIQEVEESEVVLLGHPEEPSSDPVAQLRKRMDRNNIQGVQMRVALARISAVLEKHGLIEDESWDDDTLVE